MNFDEIRQNLLGVDLNKGLQVIHALLYSIWTVAVVAC